MESGRGWHTRFCTQENFPSLVVYERKLTRNLLYYIDGTIRRRDRHLRSRQLQKSVARFSGKLRRPSRTNIPANRRPLERDPCPDHSCFSSFFWPAWCTTINTTSLCRLGKLALVFEPCRISFLCSTCNAPATLGTPVPPTDPASARGP
jgi:hypothetical protein